MGGTIGFDPQPFGVDPKVLIHGVTTREATRGGEGRGSPNGCFGCRRQNRFGIPFWLVNSPTHCRTYSSGDWVWAKIKPPGIGPQVWVVVCTYQGSTDLMG